MKELKLIRLTCHSLIPTFGALLYDGMPFALTLERPWLFNQRTVSCIPTGKYRALRCRNSPDYGYKDSPRFGDTFQVYDVPGRSYILFHKGNLNDDSHGCILVGEQFEKINGESGIAASAKGFTEFMTILANEQEFRLTVEQA